MEIDNIKEIHNLLGDDVSKYIFENRLMYSLTGHMKYIRNMVCTIGKGKEIYECLKEKKRIGVFGAGLLGRNLVHIYKDIPFECFIDNKQSEIIYEGLPVISLQEFMKRYPDGTVLISTKLYHREIEEQLQKEGFHEGNIINLGMEYEKLLHLQYFDLPQLKEKKLQREIFIDGGCYDGGTSVGFMKWCLQCWGGEAAQKLQDSRIYAWEPDPENQKKCRQLFLENRMEYELIPKGLWSKPKELRLKMNKTASMISDDGDVKIEVDSIDHVINKPVTFIKMDIEGSEYQALLGARNTIEQYKPKLAICIYHKTEDIWELPWLIHNLNPEYTFFLRHYSFTDKETVLYAL